MSAEAEESRSSSADRGINGAFELLANEVRRLENEKRLIEEKITKATAARNLLGELLSSSDTASIVAHPPKRRGRRGPSKDSQTSEVLARARKVLLEIRRPLGRAELLDAIQTDGFVIETNDPARFIGRALWRSSEFIHIPKKGYWLAKEAAV